MKLKIGSIRSILEKDPELWFFIFANIIFVAMYIWSILTTASLKNPELFALFTGLTLLHIALHWSLLRIGDNEKLFWPYVLIQGALAFVIVYLSENIGMIFALFMALIGEIIGMKQRKSRIFIAVVYLLALSLVNYVLFTGMEYSLWWAAGTLPITIFVVMYVSLYTREARGREHAQNLLKELEIAHSQLAEYATQVEELTLTTERQRMARELHDTLAQGLAGLILQLEAADSYISHQNAEKAQTIIQQAMTRARTTLADARRAIGDLRETPTTPTDLNESIQAEAELFQHSTGINCKLELCTVPLLSPALAENALRVISEGFNNIARHAEASEVILLTCCDDEYFSIEIRDNGIGFDPQEAVGRSGHYGLLGLRERARLLGGTLTIDSKPSLGTTLKIKLPMSECIPTVFFPLQAKEN